MAFYSTKCSGQSDLLEYLTGRFTYFSRDEWNALIVSGDVELNGITIRENCSINANDTIGIHLDTELSQEPSVNEDWKLLHEDGSLFIVDKPPDLPIHPAGRYKKNTLLTILERNYPGIRFHTCHRLDRETSGIVIFAKNERAGRIIAKQFQKKTIQKEYLVWVYGEFPANLRAKGFLHKDKNSIIRKKVAFSNSLNVLTPNDLKNERESIEEFSIESKSDDKLSEAETVFQKINYKNGLSLVKAIPLTGKTHQIRATLFSLGYPLLGDKIYGKDEKAFLEFIQNGWSDQLSKILGHHRQALHCSQMVFKHPETTEDMKINSPCPSDLLKFL